MLDFTYADRLLGNRRKLDMPCPNCGPDHRGASARRKCFGLLRVSDDFVVGFCFRCEVAPKLYADSVAHRSPLPRREPAPEPDREQKMADAAALWAEASDPVGTLVEVYWRARGLPLPIPPTIRFLPEHQGQPVLIGAMGLPRLDGDEWFAPDQPTAIQRVFLKSDGSWHTGVKKAKGAVLGQPLVVHVNPESLALVIAEGIEKTYRLTQRMNVDGWSASGKSFLPHLAAAVPDHVEAVTIIIDPGAEPECQQLAIALAGRGIESRGLQHRGNADA